MGRLRPAVPNRWWTVLATCLLAGVLAAAVVVWLELSNPAYRSAVTLQNEPKLGTGDGDRVLATELNVLLSDSLRDEAATALGVDPSSFSVEATSMGLSYTVVVTVQAAEPGPAQQAAREVADLYVERTRSDLSSRTTPQVLDDASQASRVGDPTRDGGIALLLGALAAATLLALERYLRPRVSRAYQYSPLDVAVLEIADGGRAEDGGAVLEEALVTSVRALATSRDPFAQSVRLVVFPGSRSAATLVDRVVAGSRGHAPLSAEDGAVVPRPVLEVLTAQELEPSLVETVPGAIVLVVPVVQAGVDCLEDLRRSASLAGHLAPTLPVIIGSRRSGMVPSRPGASSVAPLSSTV